MTADDPRKTIPTVISVLRPDGASSNETVQLPMEPTLAELKAVVMPLLPGAEYMERVHVLHNGTATDMFVDEMSQLKGLPRNERATAIYRAAWLQRYPYDDPESLPDIAGTAVLFERPVWT